MPKFFELDKHPKLITYAPKRVRDKIIMVRGFVRKTGVKRVALYHKDYYPIALLLQENGYRPDEIKGITISGALIVSVDE